MRANALKRKLAAGETVIGSIVYIPSARLAEIVSLIGFDFVVIDMEHGPIDIGVAEDMVRAAELNGATPLVRITHNSPHLMLRALDIGAQGVHVPDVNTVEDARLAVGEQQVRPRRTSRAGRRARRRLRAETAARGLRCPPPTARPW